MTADKIDDLVHEGATAEDLNAFERVDVAAGALTDPLAPLADLNKDPPLADVEMRLRVIASALNGADPLRRVAVRGLIIRRLEQLGVPSPAKFADAALGGSDGRDNGLQGRPLALADPDPWPGPVNGPELADECAQVYRDYLVLPEDGDIGLTLQSLHTYSLEAADVSPYGAITSPVRRCGKTRALTVVSTIVRRPLPASNISPQLGQGGATDHAAPGRRAPRAVRRQAEGPAHRHRDPQGLRAEAA